jgi:two-component system, OmpR family, response regulator
VIAFASIVEVDALMAEFPVQGRAILLVEDTSELAAEIESELERNGYLVSKATSLPSTEQIRTSGWSLLILDRMLFGSDALPTLETWRRQGIKTPVLVISALSSAEEIAHGLKAGADDYLAKPFELIELAARVEALLRRLADVPTTKLTFDDLEIDLLEQKAFRRGQPLSLFPRELALLEYFLRRPDQVITRMMLLNDIWRHHSAVENNVVDAHITNLRRKIDDKDRPSRIANIRGVGFMLRKSS